MSRDARSLTHDNADHESHTSFGGDIPFALTMSPFALYLKTLRANRNLRQKDLAERLGYEQSYVSALELGAKGPPNREFIDRLISKLALTEDEMGQLEDAFARSSRTIKLPASASRDLYGMFYELGRQIQALDPLQIQLINLALQVRSCDSGTTRDTSWATCQVGSATTDQKLEAAM